MSTRTDQAWRARAKAGAKAAKKLDAATDALRTFLRACNACNDGSGDEKTGAGDGRHRLIADMAEYSNFLADRFGS